MIVALGIQHEKPMCHIVICGLPGTPIFSHITPKMHDLRKIKLLNTKCVF
jgi:hypothetical protein